MGRNLEFDDMKLVQGEGLFLTAPTNNGAQREHF